MQVTQITSEDRAAAREKARLYRDAARTSGAEIDKATARVYAALAQGHAIIDVLQALRETGVDDRGRPRLAIARATWRHVFFEKRGHGGGIFSAVEAWAIMGRRPRGITGTDHVNIASDTFDEASAARLLVGSSGRIRAVVPTIPPEHRPRKNLRAYHLLFEADWQDVPTDPFLLRHLVGSLFVVLAAWDLSPVEQIVHRMIERERGAR